MKVNQFFWTFFLEYFNIWWVGILKLGFLKCLKDEKINPQEIIEFPCLKICTKTFEVVSEFHYYVQPIHHSELSNFCTELTGITQDMVKDQPVFSEVFEIFQTWLSSENTENFALVTCGDWDLNTCLEAQCQLSKIPFPKWAESWINLKKSFQKNMGYFPKGGFKTMVNQLGLEFLGRPHSGIDDTRNVAVVIKELAKNGHVFEFTSFRKQN